MSYHPADHPLTSRHLPGHVPVGHVPDRCRPTAFEEPSLSRASDAGHSDGLPRPTGLPVPTGLPRPTGLARFNAAAPAAAEAALLTCCGSHRWAERVAAHRPYPDLDSLLAASDEAGYDLPVPDLTEALAAESSAVPPLPAPRAARTALHAAHSAYESSFGHPFVISLDDRSPEEHLDHILAGIRTRLSHDPDLERSVSADELRRLARGRIVRLLSGGAGPAGRQPGPPDPRTPESGGIPGRSGCSGWSDSPSVAV
ncbi:2-oxo-4-hydroxy-4-carboxy-5-ureidoimidazoline decarboxylase [Streptomyces sp. NPDC096310]|uniref:2-oxo-4-hydroxy-4-carboxy-5-ureidoimidazoline decarboxylase n=1 Tax=Streptomyces sp. NPDC096310 TaxID=3366082 RepID=UPI00380D03FA